MGYCKVVSGELAVPPVAEKLYREPRLAPPLASTEPSLRTAIAKGAILAWLLGIPVAKEEAMKGRKTLLNSDGRVVGVADGMPCFASKNS